MDAAHFIRKFFGALSAVVWFLPELLGTARFCFRTEQGI